MFTPHASPSDRATFAPLPDGSVSDSGEPFDLTHTTVPRRRGYPEVFAIVLAVGLPVTALVSFGRPFLPYAVSGGMVFLIYKALLFVTSRASLATSEPAWNDARESVRGFVPFVCLLTASYSIYLLAFFPGAMSYDSLNQWRQMATLTFNSWHPPLYALTMWALTRVWYSPAAIVAFQIIIQVLAVCFALTTLARLGGGRALLWALTLFYSLFPIYGVYTVVLWKDVPYSIALLVLTTLLLRILSSGGAELDSKRFQVGLGIILALIPLLRQDGVLPYVGSLAALLVFGWQRPRRLHVVLSVAVGVVLIVRYPVYDALKVTEVEGSVFSGKVHFFQIAAVVASGASISEQDRKTIEEILTFEKIRQLYTPYTGDIMLNDPGRSWDRERDEDRVFHLWLRLVWENPGVIARHIYKNRSVFWRVIQLPDAHLVPTLSSLIQIPKV